MRFGMMAAAAAACVVAAPASAATIVVDFNTAPSGAYEAIFGDVFVRAESILEAGAPGNPFSTQAANNVTFGFVSGVPNTTRWTDYISFETANPTNNPVRINVDAFIGRAFETVVYADLAPNTQPFTFGITYPYRYTFRLTGGPVDNLMLETVSGVPEAATWMLMMVGVGAAGGVLRRAPKRRQLQPAV